MTLPNKMIDIEDPEYTSMTMAQILQRREADEAEALKKYGVVLAEDHHEGYTYKPERFEINEASKPWEGDLLAQIPEAPQLNTVENWGNDSFKFELSDGIAYMTLNRPEANNAMNEDINQGLWDSIHILRKRADIRVAVLTGTGRMFCAGGDPKQFQRSQVAGGAIVAEEGQERPTNPEGPAIAKAKPPGGKAYRLGTSSFAKCLFEFSRLPQFTIACLNGSAMGGGVGLACICDMVISTKSAQIVLSEVKLGVIPATISPHVVGKIGIINAKRLFCTAEAIKPPQAKEMGLTQVIVDDPSKFPAAIKEVCTKMQQCAPGAVKATKMAISMLMNQPPCESLIQWTAKEYARIRKSDEAQAGMKALASKKKPAWMEAQIKPRE